MTAPEPTRPAEHIDAVARAMRQDPKSGGRNMSDVAREVYAERLLTLTDPAVHAAMLDALVRAGVLTEHTFQSFGGKWTLTLSTEPRAIDQDEALDLLRKRLTGGVAP